MAPNEKATEAATSNGPLLRNTFTVTEYHNGLNLQVALDLAAAGFAVFPCGPDKKPRVKDWPGRATADAGAIREWWGKWPDSVPGLPTGARNGVAVLDLDRKNDKNGIAALSAMGFNPFALSPFTVDTPSGGLHLYFTWPEGLGNASDHGKLGIDVRGQGGYVIAPGAAIPSGTYQALGGVTLGRDLPVWPEAVLKPRAPAAALPAVIDLSDLWGEADCEDMTPADLKALREPDVETIRSALRAIEDASDRDTWFRIGAALHDEFAGSAEGFKWWCKWSRRCPEKYNERDQRTAWQSFGKPRGGDPITIASVYQIAAASGWVRPVSTPAAAAAKPSRLSFLSPSDCDTAPSRGYLIKGLLAPRDVGCIFGAPGAGKSLLAPFLGYALARGVEAFGMRTKAGGVFYVAAEDPHGMRGRVKALRQRHGDAPGFTLVDGVSDLLRADSPDLAALLDAVKARTPALIILDTLAMSFPGLEENSAEAMGRVMAVARKLTEWGAAVVLIHHDTKAEGATPRGHSLLNGALDMALHVKRDEAGVIRGTLTKNRNGTCARDLAFTIATEEAGPDEDGDPITLPMCDPFTDLFEDVLTAKERAALEPLISHHKAQAGFSEEGAEPQHIQSSIPVDEWRDLCRSDPRLCKSDNPESQSKAFKRVRDDLVRKGLVRLVRDGTEVELCNSNGLPALH